MIRAVLDSNVLVSAALEMESGAGAPAEILRRVERREFTLVLSDAIIDEVAHVFGAKRSLQQRLLPTLVRQYLFDLVLVGEMVALAETSQALPPIPTTIRSSTRWPPRAPTGSSLATASSGRCARTLPCPSRTQSAFSPPSTRPGSRPAVH